jgi:predicted SAM-dependent methyltransferase
MAVLEHLAKPEYILREIQRVLRPCGILAGTVPSDRAKPILEFLSYRLGIVNPDEIRDHKRYYNRKTLFAILEQTGFVHIRHSYFQLGLNNRFAAEKASVQLS